MEFLNKFRDWPDQVEFAKGETIFSLGDPADYVYVVLDGEVEIVHRDEPLAAELPGGVFGEMALVDANRAASAAALRPSRLARITRDQFADLIREDPEIAFHLIGVIANRLRAAVALIRY